MDKFIHKLILLTAGLSLQTSGFASETMLGVMERCFPGQNPEKMVQILQGEPSLSPVPVPSGQDYGYNMNKLTPFHITFLEQCPDQNVLEIGPGSGHFTAKILAAGARGVHGVEYGVEAIQKIYVTVRNYETSLNIDNLTPRLSVTQGDILRATLPSNTYDSVLAANVFHLQTPRQVMETVLKIKPTLIEGGRLYVLMNVPSGQKSFVNTYLQARDKGSIYPGYLQTHRVDEQIYQTNPQGNPVKLLEKTRTFYEGSSSLGLKDDLSPLTLTTKSCSLISRNGNQATVHVKIDHPHFFGDKDSINNLLSEAGFAIETAYYIDSRGQRHNEIDWEYAKNTPHALAIIAKKN
jgi:SAM-dependent methyltransferase